MELVSPDLAVVASHFTNTTSSEFPHIAGTNIIIIWSVLAQIRREQRIELQLSLLRRGEEQELNVLERSEFCDDATAVTVAWIVNSPIGPPLACAS